MRSDIWFQKLGLHLQDVGTGIEIFGFRIAYYGMIIALGMIAGILLAQWQAKRTGQSTELYLDFALYGIVFAIIGARLYYVVFYWSEFKDNLWNILNTRTGGMAIYGGVIAAIITAIIYCRAKKVSFFLLADTGVLGLILGQVIGRWGNFFNREAFGRYYDGLLSMQINLQQVGGDYVRSVASLEQKYAQKPETLQNIMEIRNHPVVIDGIEYISVHPTFLYESLWNLCLLIILIIYSKHKKFDGEILSLYFVGYGIGRLWIEGMRTDQLFLWGTEIAVSQVVSAIIILMGLAFIVYKRRRVSKKQV